MAAKKHVAVLPGEHLSFHHVLSASQTKHLQIARSLHAEGGGGGLDERGLLADCDHNPLKRGRFSKTGKMMSQLRHGCIWSEEAERPLVRSEILNLQGFPTIEQDDDHPCPLPWDASGVSTCGMWKLSGNGMHMHVLVLLMVWMLSAMEVETPSG